MKTKNIWVVCVMLATMGMLSSCGEDFLERPPQDAIVDANFYQNDDQVLAGAAALYTAAWKSYVDQANWKIGDVRAGLVYSPWVTSSDIRDFTTHAVTGTSAANVDTYKAFYVIIGQANSTINNLNQFATSEVSEEVLNHVMAECRFMRATAYSFLVLNYGPVPLIENNVDHLDDSEIRRHTVESVWEFIRRDYVFAKDNLMDESPLEGRVNRWSAEGMLARTYLTMAGITGSINSAHLDSAQYYADRVINLSGKTLMSNYSELFTYPYDNNNESLFELQWIFALGDFYAWRNSSISQITPHSSLAGNGDGWGGGIGATNYMLSLYDGLYVDYDGERTAAPGRTLDERLHESFFIPGARYPGLPKHDDTFLDENDAVIYSPNEIENDDPTTGHGRNFAWIKKYVLGAIEGESGFQNYPQNTYMMRLAEMYLIKAEAAFLQGDEAIALENINVTRERAGLSDFSGTLTWEDIFEERAKEFAMEGSAWYDLCRRHYYAADDVYRILNSQDRDMFLIVPEPEDNPTDWSVYKKTEGFDGTEVQQVGSGNFMMSIPQQELSQAPSLGEEPVVYEFAN